MGQTNVPHGTSGTNSHKACALGNVGSLRCDPVLAPHHYFLRYSFLPIRPNCDCGHRLSFSPPQPWQLRHPTCGGQEEDMAPKSDKLFAKATTKLGLATTIAALWLTVVPITGAVANEQISAARAAALQGCNR